jgi:hypothetical protein
LSVGKGASEKSRLPGEALPAVDALRLVRGEREEEGVPVWDADAAGERLAVPPDAHAEREGSPTDADAESGAEGENATLLEAAPDLEAARLGDGLGATVPLPETEARREAVAAELGDAPADAVPPSLLAVGKGSHEPTTLWGEAVPRPADALLRGLADARALVEAATDALSERETVMEGVPLGVALRQMVAEEPGEPLAPIEAEARGVLVPEAVPPSRGLSVGKGSTENRNPPGVTVCGALGDAEEREVTLGEGDCAREGDTELEEELLREALPDAEGPATVPLTLRVATTVLEEVELVDSEADCKLLFDTEGVPLSHEDTRAEREGELDALSREDAEFEEDTEGEEDALFVVRPALMESEADAEGVFELLTEAVLVFDTDVEAVPVLGTLKLAFPEGVLLDVCELDMAALLVVVFDAEAEPEGVREADVEAVEVAVGVSELVTEPLAVGDADLPALLLSLAERLAELVAEGPPEAVPSTLDVAVGRPGVGESEGRAEAVSLGEALTVALTVAVARAVLVAVAVAVRVLVPVELLVAVAEAVPPEGDTEAEGDWEGLIDTDRDLPADAVTEGDCEARTVQEEDADSVEVFEAVVEEVEVTEDVLVTVGVALSEAGAEGLAAPVAVAFPTVTLFSKPAREADAAGEPLTLGEGEALLDASEAEPVEEADLAEEGEAALLAVRAAEPDRAPVRVGSHTEAVGVGGAVRVRLGEGEVDADTPAEAVNEVEAVEDLVPSALRVAEPDVLSVPRADAERADEPVLGAVALVRGVRVPVFLSQSTVDVAVEEGDGDVVRVSLNSPMVIVGDAVMDAHTEDVGVLEEEEEPVDVIAEVLEADREPSEVAVALLEVEGVADDEDEREAAAEDVFEVDTDAVCVGENVDLPLGEPLPPSAALEGLRCAEGLREAVEEEEGATEALASTVAETLRTGDVLWPPPGGSHARNRAPINNSVGGRGMAGPEKAPPR